MNSLHYNIRVKGRVQGVWFRKYVFNLALKIGLKGFVKNDVHGLVYAEAEGDLFQLIEFIKMLEKGSPLSRVDSVGFKEGEIQGFTIFEIHYR